MANPFTAKNPAGAAMGELALGTFVAASAISDLMQPLFELPQHDQRYPVETMVAVMNEANHRIDTLNDALQAAADDRAEIEAVAVENREYVIDLELKLETAMAEIERLQGMVASSPEPRRRSSVTISALRP